VPQQLTSYGGLEFLHRYVRRLGLYPRLRRACADLGGDYSGARLSLLLLALFYVGARRDTMTLRDLYNLTRAREPTSSISSCRSCRRAGCSVASSRRRRCAITWGYACPSARRA